MPRTQDKQGTVTQRYVEVFEPGGTDEESGVEWGHRALRFHAWDDEPHGRKVEYFRRRSPKAAVSCVTRTVDKETFEVVPGSVDVRQLPWAVAEQWLREGEKVYREMGEPYRLQFEAEMARKVVTVEKVPSGYVPSDEVAQIRRELNLLKNADSGNKK